MLILKNTKQLPFWLFTISVILILIVSQLIQDGVFMDGMLYISVSKNLSEGIGTFWNPHFSKTSMSSFHEQPPLYFGLLALFYKLFGPGMYTERLFCFICFVVTVAFIHKLWNKIFINNSAIAKNSWLPILFFTSIPICFWAFTNHVEETVMVVFALLAVYFFYIALYLKKRIYLNLILGGIFVFLSSLTKGIQGLFPIVSAGAYWIVQRDSSFKKMVLYSLTIFSVPLCLYAFFIITDNAVLVSYQKYFSIRILGTFNHVGATTDDHFELFVRLLTELIPCMTFVVIVFFVTRNSSFRHFANRQHQSKLIWVLLIGLSGSLPLMVTLEQRGFYLVTTLPYFAIVLAMFIAPRLTALTEKMNKMSYAFRMAKVITIVLVVVSAVYCVMQIGKAKRDEELLHDVYAIGKIIPHGEIINIPTEMWNDWSLTSYLVRYFYISCDGGNEKHKYYLIRKDLRKNVFLKDYTPYPIKSKCLDLYVMKK